MLSDDEHFSSDERFSSDEHVSSDEIFSSDEFGRKRRAFFRGLDERMTNERARLVLVLGLDELDEPNEEPWSALYRKKSVDLSGEHNIELAIRTSTVLITL